MLHAILRWLTDAALADAMVGDLEEQRRQRHRRSKAGAWLWYVRAAAALTASLALRRALEALSSVGRQRLGVAGLAGEIAQALRSLRRTPASTAVIIATLGLGVGLNAAIFSVVHGVLFEPLPFDSPERVVIVQGQTGGRDAQSYGTSLIDFRDLQRGQRTFESLATSAYWTLTLTGTETPLRLVGARVSGEFFGLLGARPLLGRTVEPADDRAGAEEVALLSHRLWRQQFGGDPAIVGREMRLNGVRARVIGVMPASFRFPAEDVELWLAMRGELEGVPRNSRFLLTIGRLKPGVTTASAEADLRALAGGLAAAFPDSNKDWMPVVTAALPALTQQARPRLLLLFAGVVVVLLVACVNVAALIGSRGAARAREFAVRSALGAGRMRLLRVTFLESAWLCAAGLLLGVAIAAPAIGWLRSIAPQDIPRLDDVSLSWTVIAWAAAAMTVFAIAGAIAPLVQRDRAGLERLRGSAVAGSMAGWGRRGLVAAGLLVRSFTRVLAVDPGFDAANVAMMRVFLTPPTYRSLESQRDFVARAVDHLNAMPGVTGAAAVSEPPFDDNGSGTSLEIGVEGETYAPGSRPQARYRATSSDYFRVMGMRLLDGQGFTNADREGTTPVVVINRTMAERLWPARRAVGQRLEFADGRNAGWQTVIGVVNDVATDGLEVREPPTVYAPFRQRTLPFLRWMTFVVRTDGDVDAGLAAIRRRLQEVDPNQPLYGVTTMATVMRRSMAERRFSLSLMTAFAALTVLLAAIGLYGALAQAVSRRVREIGVRLAVGARPSEVFRLVVTDGLGVVGVGIASGALLSWLASARIESLLFGVPGRDAVTYATITVILIAAGLAACIVPAARASRIDPVRALRAE
ncbi:MAG TPA: ABC transporter permease [Vicinamibacterales bacterium]|nr:ABC transporter permease [Vicinamibacterales bacterium]